MAKVCDGCRKHESETMLHETKVAVEAIGYEKIAPMLRDMCGDCIDKMVKEADPANWAKEPKRRRSPVAQKA